MPSKKLPEGRTAQDVTSLIFRAFTSRGKESFSRYTVRLPVAEIQRKALVSVESGRMLACKNLTDSKLSVFTIFPSYNETRYRALEVPTKTSLPTS